MKTIFNIRYLRRESKMLSYNGLIKFRLLDKLAKDSFCRS